MLASVNSLLTPLLTPLRTPLPQDIEDSIARVDMMLKLKAAGRYGEALKLAIQQSEVEELHKLKERYGDGSPNCLARCFSFLNPPLPPVRTPECIRRRVRTHGFPR